MSKTNDPETGTDDVNRFSGRADSAVPDPVSGAAPAPAPQWRPLDRSGSVTAVSAYLEHGKLPSGFSGASVALPADLRATSTSILPGAEGPAIGPVPGHDMRLETNASLRSDDRKAGAAALRAKQHRSVGGG